MAITEQDKQELQESVDRARDAGRLSLGPALLPLVMPVKVCPHALYELGRVELGRFPALVRESAARALTWLEAAQEYGDLEYTDWMKVRDHVNARESARLAELPVQQGED